MEVQAHTTPESRQALKEYLRNRRMTSSVHLTIATMALNDLEEALHLLGTVQPPNATLANEVETFLARCASSPAPNRAWALPGLLEGE